MINFSKYRITFPSDFMRPVLLDNLHQILAELIKSLITKPIDSLVNEKGRQKTKRNINDDKAQAKSTNIVIVLQAKICRINSLISLFSSVEQSIWQLSGVVYPLDKGLMWLAFISSIS